MTDEIMNNRTIRFPKILEKRIEKASDDFSEFVRQACIEKLSRKIKEDKDNEGVEKFIDEMIALHPKRRMADIQNSNDLIFTELKKQNEILKLILRRTTTANRVACSSLKHLTDSSTVQVEVDKARDAVVIDLKNINLQGYKYE